MWRWLRVWEEIIKLQALEMRLLWRPRQSSLFLLTAALCSLMALIETVMARHQMTFPLVLWRGRTPFTCILPLFLFLYCSTLWPPSTCSYPWRRWKRCLWISRWVIAFIYAQRCCVHFFYWVGQVGVTVPLMGSFVRWHLNVKDWLYCVLQINDMWAPPEVKHKHLDVPLVASCSIVKSPSFGSTCP